MNTQSNNPATTEKKPWWLFSLQKEPDHIVGCGIHILTSFGRVLFVNKN